MTDEPDDIRREAEDRVRLRFERQNTALTEWQRQECERAVGEARMRDDEVGFVDALVAVEQDVEHDQAVEAQLK